MDMYTETTDHITLNDTDLRQKFPNTPASAQGTFRDQLINSAMNGEFFELPPTGPNDEVVVELTAKVRIIKRTATITRND